MLVPVVAGVARRWPTGLPIEFFASEVRPLPARLFAGTGAGTGCRRLSVADSKETVVGARALIEVSRFSECRPGSSCIPTVAEQLTLIGQAY